MEEQLQNACKSLYRQHWGNESCICGNSSCTDSALRFCGACKVTRYCSIKCQKDDWKRHKKLCCKKMSSEILPIDEVAKIMKRSYDQAASFKHQGRLEAAIEVLECAILYADYQFGPRIDGKSHRIRSNGDHIDSWQSVTMPMCLALLHLSDILLDMHTPSALEKALVHAVEARVLIKPQESSMEFGELDYRCLIFFRIEVSLADICIEMSQLVEAEVHCIELLRFANKCHSKNNYVYLYEALKRNARLRKAQGRLSEAIALTEEAYISVSDAKGPENAEVQEAAVELIECLMITGQLSRAEAFSRITYENLIDPSNGIDQNSDQVARGMQQLAWICLRITREDKDAPPSLLVEAESLIKNACDVTQQLHGHPTTNLTVCLAIYGDILMQRDASIEEIRCLFERVLRVYRGAGAVGCSNATECLTSLGMFLKVKVDKLPIGEEREVERKVIIDLLHPAVEIISAASGLGLGSDEASLPLRAILDLI